MFKPLGLLILLITGSGSQLFGAETKYAVSNIPDSLLENAKAVVRESSLIFEMKNPKNCIEKRHSVITILDRSGDDYATGFFPYDKERRIVSLSATIYSKYGEVIKRVYTRDFKDRSYDLFGSLYSDTRYKILAGASGSYPYTIEYKVVYDLSYSYNFPHWIPQGGYDLSVQLASFSLIVPEEYNATWSSYKAGEPFMYIEKGEKIYQWNLKGVKAVENEVYSPSFRQVLPNVDVSPGEFAFDGYSGDMASWTDFGRFFYQLNEGRDDISEAHKSKILEMVAGVSDPGEKAEILYKYMQDRTRYVSIQVGIGGIQPFPASTVEEYGYGDCKALTNYMKTILEVAGVPAYYSLIRAGRAKYNLDTNFVSNRFNHVILHVPLADEDLWLECTSQTMPFGFLGDFTDDRYALVITENGGVLKRTASYDLAENTISSCGTVMISDDGDASASIINIYRGLEYDNLLRVLNMNYEDQEDYLYDYKLDIPDFRIRSFKYEDIPSPRPQATEYLELDLIRYASKSGNRMFIPLNLQNKFDYIPPRDNDRKTPIIVTSDRHVTDSIWFKIPTGFQIEYIPEGDTVKTEFGEYAYRVTAMEDKVLYVRNHKLYRKNAPPDQYDVFVDFCRTVTRQDKQKLILIRNESTSD